MTKEEARHMAERITLYNKGEQVLTWLVTQAILDAFEEGVRFEREAQAIRQHEGHMAGRG